jgi:hypothetical protein
MRADDPMTIDERRKYLTKMQSRYRRGIAARAAHC